MDYEISKERLRDFIKLPKTFDWDWVDQELGFRKIFSFVPKETYAKLPKDGEIYRLLTKAAVHYAIVLDFPRAKVQLSNYGIDQPNQDKTKPAPWWDVRDLGLKYLKTADACLSDALSLLYGDGLKDEVPFFAESGTLIATPEAFNSIYNINSSPEVFRMMVPLMKRAMDTFIFSKILPCSISDISADPELSRLLKNAVANFALHLASEMPNFTLTNSSVVVQYEELPWQKSVVLSNEQRMGAARTFRYAADEALNSVLAYIAANTAKFPCYTTAPVSTYDPVKKRSGLYLL